MPILTDPKRERFAQYCARGDSATDAYVRAGYRRNSGNASAMRSRPDVRARIQEIQEMMNKSTEKDLEDYLDDVGLNKTYIVKQMVDVAHDARNQGNMKIALEAWEKLGRELFAMFTPPDKKAPQENKDDNNPFFGPTAAIPHFVEQFARLPPPSSGPTINGQIVGPKQGREKVAVRHDPNDGD